MPPLYTPNSNIPPPPPPPPTADSDDSDAESVASDDPWAMPSEVVTQKVTRVAQGSGKSRGNGGRGDSRVNFGAGGKGVDDPMHPDYRGPERVSATLASFVITPSY